VGLVASVTGSLVARGATPPADDAGGGSTPTWIASDGQGGRIGKPGPHSVGEATA
jgi:hypothetical protein